MENKKTEKKSTGYQIIDVEQLISGINIASMCSICKREKSKLELYEKSKQKKDWLQSYILSVIYATVSQTLKTLRKYK